MSSFCCCRSSATAIEAMDLKNDSAKASALAPGTEAPDFTLDAVAVLTVAAALDRAPAAMRG